MQHFSIAELPTCTTISRLGTGYTERKPTRVPWTGVKRHDASATASSMRGLLTIY
jgi:hypothetical protein